MLAPETILQNRYRIMRELGHGGMGTVYEALDQRVNCIVALKETAAGQSDEARQAFEREASLLGNLRHSSLPKVMDYFSEESGDFLVMEFIPGYDLAELLDSRESPFPQTQVLRWADELLRVLEYLHRQDPPILHRDIKPSNLKLTKQGEIFLLDFGLAKGSTGQMPTLMTSRSVRGYTPVYASLEQIHGYGTEARSDLYSLGATLYHLLTGVAPIDAPARFHFTEEDQADPLPPIESLNSNASPKVAAVIQQAMAINRKQRPVSAADMRRALRDAAEEDERFSAEAEYARAEAKRQQRQDERSKAAPAPTIAAEGPREAEAKREAETRRQAEEQRRQAEATQRAEADDRALAEKRAAAEAEKRRAEEERLRREAEERGKQQRAEAVGPTQPPKTVMAKTVRSPEPPPKTKPTSRAVETIHAPPPERVSRDQFSSSQSSPSVFSPAVADNGKRNVVIGAVVLVIVAGIAILIWSLSGTTSQDATSKTQPGQKTGPGNNTPTPPAGMVYVPGGEFMMGSDNGIDVAEGPAHKVAVKPFFIEIYPITFREYSTKFLFQTTGHYASQKIRSWADAPVTEVTWDDANAYCKWAGKRLPTEEEWEFAARGTDGRVYPWGNEWQQGLANANGAEKERAVVDKYKGSSPFGAFDLVGNAWEWTASAFVAYPGGNLPPDQPSGELKVIRGGSYESTKNYATTTYRTGWPARGAKTYAQTGFRCVKDVAQ